MNQLRTGVTLLFREWRSVVGWTVLVVVAAFTVSLVVYAFLGGEARQSSQTFGVGAVTAVWAIAHLSLVGDLFPFAVGFGLTRRAFAVALAVHATILAIVYGVAITVLTMVETATGGWGVDLEFFGPLDLGSRGPAVPALVYTVTLLLLASGTVLAAAIHGRWGPGGVMVTAVATLLVGAAVSALVTTTDRWGSVADWFGDQSVEMLFIVWPLPLVAAFSVGAHATMRRMAP